MEEEQQHIEVVGAGFVPGIPGIFGNQRITRDGQVVAPPVVAPVSDDEEPIPDAAPAQPAPQSSSRKANS